jgi:hypothetical protein
MPSVEIAVRVIGGTLAGTNERTVQFVLYHGRPLEAFKELLTGIHPTLIGKE